MEEKKEKAAFICVQDTIDGAYPSLVLGINAARLGMETKIFYSFMGLNMVLKGGVDRAKFFPPGVMGAIPGMTTIATGMMKKKIDQWNFYLLVKSPRLLKPLKKPFKRSLKKPFKRSLKKPFKRSLKRPKVMIGKIVNVLFCKNK